MAEAAPRIEVTRLPVAGDPELLVRAARALGDAVLWESSGEPPQGRRAVLAGPGRVLLRWNAGEQPPAQLWLPLRRELASCRLEPLESAGFTGGLSLLLGYDARHLFEDLPARHPRRTALPDLLCRRHLALLAACEGERDLRLYRVRSPGDLHRDRESGEEAQRLLAALAAASAEDPGGRLLGSPPSEPDPHRHRWALARAREHLERGDVYQVNLAERWEFPRPADPAATYAALRRRNPPAQGGLLLHAGEALLSLSPECFLRVEGRRVLTRPIKGTAARGRSAGEDRDASEGLLASEKDRAELAMIVDVLRNDFHRVARPGSVRVTEPIRLESHPTVHHLVAGIEAELHLGRDIFDLLAASFPGGSVTGAPRLRAMEVIDALEDRAALNLLIRTAYTAGDRLLVHGGGGITILSDPEAELRECRAKVRAFLEVLAGEVAHVR
jgi:para-aminobenzoate synthetase component 1